MGSKVDVQALPAYVKFVLYHIQQRLLRRTTIHCRRGRPRQGHYIERFRSDAKAEGEQIVLGGYETHDCEGTPVPHLKARWFLLELNRKNAPWAYSRGEPFRSIASLELLGSLVSIMLLLEDGSDDGSSFHGGALSVGPSPTTSEIGLH